MKREDRLLSALLGCAIVLTWCVVAFVLEQPLWASQRSRLLLSAGAADGDLVLANGQWWRIVTSQFLHVHALHMLFNAACVTLVGVALERRYGWQRVALLFFLGGSVGQVASVLAYPHLVSSGASQALMALCGAALVLPAERRMRWFVLALVAIQAGLDLYVAQTIK
ncbi:MAG TPA: rhomboid family intramembrane serine protease, partial [Ramlibacter sp.]|nr:rhomboid family intramembrane serine protease [Ramlibacter sp.]